MKGWRIARIVPLMCVVLGAAAVSFGQGGATPLEFLQEQERKQRSEQGVLYLGKIMDVDLGNSDSPGEKDRGLLLELTDVLKSPIRDGYRLVLKGCAAGSAGEASEAERVAGGLRKILVQKYGLEESRISTVGGCKGPAGRVEVHVHGDIAKAVRFTGDGEK